MPSLLRTEVHHAVVVLVATALVTGGDVAVVVAAGLLELGFQQRRIGCTLVQVVARDLDHGTLAGEVGFILMTAMITRPPRTGSAPDPA
jgi:hypothetical protein